jgi:signal transduction histidine kinase
MDNFSKDIALINGIDAVPTILDVVCRTTGMGFAAVARVTEGRWVACSVLDHIDFGLKVGGELVVETTICHEIREVQEPVIIDHVDLDEVYRDHHTPRMYGFQSYISMPIFSADGEFFGTLCAIDPKPAVLNTPGVTGMFKMFAELIGFHIDAAEKLAASESRLLEERGTSELREQFIAVLGHDLRSPLNAVSMGAALLKESGLEERQAMLADMIEKSASAMSDLIEDVMDFARGRLGGGIALDRSDLPLQPVLEEMIESMRTVWPERRIEAGFALEEKIDYDRKRLSQLFTNLLSNAMNYGKPDQPVKVRAVSGGGRFELSVANAAVPIHPSKLEKLFEPFSRGDSATYQDGLGLGLYIASQIAKSHGGVLEAASTEEETRFTFSMESRPAD